MPVVNGLQSVWDTVSCADGGWSGYACACVGEGNWHINLQSTHRFAPSSCQT
eukprot:m.116076 g.116076  ORF g.116076 m.116076 type:complete len:52 (-) comp13119_c0_seq5:505-660(-)